MRHRDSGSVPVDSSLSAPLARFSINRARLVECERQHRFVRFEPVQGALVREAVPNRYLGFYLHTGTTLEPDRPAEMLQCSAALIPVLSAFPSIKSASVCTYFSASFRLASIAFRSCGWPSLRLWEDGFHIARSKGRFAARPRLRFPRFL